MKKIYRCLAVLIVFVLATSLFANSAMGDNRHWQNRSLSSNAHEVAVSSDRFVCGHMPNANLSGDQFTVEFNFDGSVTADAGDTGKNPRNLVNSNITFGYEGKYSSIQLPVHNASYESSEYMVFGDANHGLLTGGVRPCIMVFRQKPWGTELARSYWEDPTFPDDLCDEDCGGVYIDTALPYGDNWYKAYGAFQALMTFDRSEI